MDGHGRVEVGRVLVIAVGDMRQVQIGGNDPVTLSPTP